MARKPKRIRWEEHAPGSVEYLRMETEANVLLTLARNRAKAAEAKSTEGVVFQGGTVRSITEDDM